MNTLNAAKERVDNLAAKDLLGLDKRINKNQNNQEENKKLKNNVYTLIVLIPLLLIISFVFYMIATIDGAMFGTPDDEIDSIISDKIKSIIQVASKDGDSETGSHIGDSFEKI